MNIIIVKQKSNIDVEQKLIFLLKKILYLFFFRVKFKFMLVYTNFERLFIKDVYNGELTMNFWI